MTFFTSFGFVAMPTSRHMATRPDLVVTGSGGLELHAGAGRAVQRFGFSGDSLRFLGNRTSSSDTISANISGWQAALETRHVDLLASQSSATITRSDLLFSGQTGLSSQQIPLLAIQQAGQSYYLTARPDTGRLYTLRENGNSLSTVHSLSDTDFSYLGDPHLMVGVEHGEQQIILVASEQDSGVSAFSMNNSGRLTLRDNLGRDQGVGIGNPSAMLAVESGGQVLVLVAGSQSNNITVMALGADGTLRLRTQLTDSRDTRFGGITAMEAITVNNQTYIVAAGSDDGLALLLLLPDGRLVHLQSLADSPTLGLDNVNALALDVSGSQLRIFASSETEPGVTYLNVNLAGRLIRTGGGGNDSLNGGGGNDLLSDGGGRDTLTGGGGRDLFVLDRDGQSDMIRDFDITRDRIDLSAWERLYSIDQLSFSNLSGGIRLRYGTETLDIRTHNGHSLSYSDFQDRDLLGLFRPLPPRDPPVRATGTSSGNQMSGARGNDRLDGRAGNDVIDGRAGRDTLIGGSGNDTLFGGLGNDILQGDSGNDSLRGEEGNDTIQGNSGNDRLWGENGNDSLTGATGQDLLWGGAGRDTLVGGDDADRLYGEADNDLLRGGNGRDTLWGGSGNDRLDGDNSDDLLEGGSGNDRLDGGAGADTLLGQEGRDTLIGSSGPDSLRGGAQDDTLEGGSATDVLRGEDGNDSLSGGTGDDTLYGGDGNDTLFGNTSLDTLWGGAGDDFISSGDGIDWVDGGSGNDTIYGRSGLDTLYGGSGHDTLIGSEGIDALTGGTGHDWLGGGSGWDSLYGNSGDDTLYGNFGSDYLSGGAGPDSLLGGTGDDTLVGGGNRDTLLGNQGLDRLEGGVGDDLLRGGTLRDTFVFARGHDRDEINDFETFNDRLLLSRALTDGQTSDSAILSRFGSVRDGVVVLDFGQGDVITLSNLSSLDVLNGTIDTF